MKYDQIAEAYKALYESSIDSIITEELHPEIKQILTSNDIQPEHRFTILTRKIRELIKSGQDTGLTDDRPKKGSSRAVMFMSEPHKAIVDGKEAEIPHVLKIAFHGSLDRYRDPDTQLLGDLQNHHEIDNRHHSMLVEVGHNRYETNHDGFLPPILDFHDFGNWMSVGKISPIGAGQFRELTKTTDFKRGISDREFRTALSHHVAIAHGKNLPSWQYEIPKEKAEDLLAHPLVTKALNFCVDSGTNPEDFQKRNLGIWKHPITGESHIVASDAGFSNNVMTAYMKAYQKRGY